MLTSSEYFQLATNIKKSVFQTPLEWKTVLPVFKGNRREHIHSACLIRVC